MKKIFYEICSFVFLIALASVIFFQTNIFVDNVLAENESNFTNLIVFAKFSGETEFVNDICSNTTSIKQVVENSYSKSEYSVADYYSCVSNGKVNMQSLYLFSGDGGSLTLTNPRGYYCAKSDTNEIGYESSEYSLRLSTLRQDWSNAITNALNNGCKITNFDRSVAYGYDDLDKNNDGYIDCLTIIYKYSDEFSVSWSDCLWNYQSNSFLIELNSNNKTITSNAYFQFTANFSYLYSDKNNVKFASLKTMIHETGHIFGLKDLYKSESVSPVYYMSAMSNAISPVPQYISAKEREVLGWLDSKNISKITNAGTYDINVTTSTQPSGIVCYKCDILSLNKTLYLEYRSFDTSDNKYDSQSKEVYNQDNQKIKGISLKSGLVCFLIDSDTMFPNNLYSSANNWNYQVLGGQYATKSDSALKKGESLSITSGLEIEVIDTNDGVLKFKITGDDISAEDSHNLELFEYKDSTCTTLGNIEYYYCNHCNKYFDKSMQEISYQDTIIKLKNHTPQVVYGKSPTCTETGLSDGSVCAVCDKVLISQEVLPITKHNPSDWIVDKVATTTNAGEKHKECTNCGKTLQTEIIPKLNIETPDDTPPKIDSSFNKTDAVSTIIKILYVVSGAFLVKIIVNVITSIF